MRQSRFAITNIHITRTSGRMASHCTRCSRGVNSRTWHRAKSYSLATYWNGSNAVIGKFSHECYMIASLLGERQYPSVVSSNTNLCYFLFIPKNTVCPSQKCVHNQYLTIYCFLAGVNVHKAGPASPIYNKSSTMRPPSIELLIVYRRINPCNIVVCQCCMRTNILWTRSQYFLNFFFIDFCYDSYNKHKMLGRKYYTTVSNWKQLYQTYESQRVRFIWSLDYRGPSLYYYYYYFFSLVKTIDFYV